MKVRPKLTGAPLGYTLSLVEGTGIYSDFGKALWHDDRAIDPKVKELLFMRSSIVNECPT